MITPRAKRRGRSTAGETSRVKQSRRITHGRNTAGETPPDETPPGESPQRRTYPRRRLNCQFLNCHVLGCHPQLLNCHPLDRHPGRQLRNCCPGLPSLLPGRRLHRGFRWSTNAPAIEHFYRCSKNNDIQQRSQCSPKLPLFNNCSSIRKEPGIQQSCHID